MLSAGCTKEILLYCDESDLEECRVAVVLPLSDGQEAQWKQCLEICSNNLADAFCKTGMGVRLVYEWYDELSPDIRKTAEELASRDDIKAVIGGLYSDNALILADALCAKDKPLFTLATTDQLIRGYSNWGNLWAMTETDITQCEVMLSKVMQYGAKSVALLVNGESAYGNTFVDWFPFQAQELGIRNAGVFSCTDNTEEQTRAALATDADYILCALSDIKTVGKVLSTYNSTPHTAKLLMSDVTYISDALAKLGDMVEGIDGLVNFEGESVSELVDSFHGAVDDYIEYCTAEGLPIHKSYSGNLNIRISPETHGRLALHAMKAGISLNALISKSLDQALASL